MSPTEKLLAEARALLNVPDIMTKHTKRYLDRLVRIVECQREALQDAVDTNWDQCGHAFSALNEADRIADGLEGT